MLSIDQNCHSLWDVIPKLQALSRKGLQVTQCIEDIDVAFTSMGSQVHSAALRLERERFYRSGGADWGAALFYSEFLGKLPTEIRHWEPFTGMKTTVLAKQLGRQVDDLYDEFSPGDNWQLVGPSYVDDQRHHRIIGDLQAAEVADYLCQVMGIAKEDVLRRFPQKDCHRRAVEWFDCEQRKLDSLIATGAQGLTDVYGKWSAPYLDSGSVHLADASHLFTTGAGHAPAQVLELFTRQYELLADLYNQAVTESHLGLHLLDKARGDLPFFGVFRYQGHMVRSQAYLEGGLVRIADMTFPLEPSRGLPWDKLKSAGILALPGKAIVLVLQVRLGENGHPLAMPYHGSMYMPAAFALERLLRQRGLLEEPVQPVIRVRFHFLDRLRSLDSAIVLPEHLAACFGREEIPARDLGDNWQTMQSEAALRLEGFKDASYRRRWLRTAMTDLDERIAQLDASRRELASQNEKDPRLREIWKQIKPLEVRQLDGLLRQIACDWQVSQIDYWDSRGALIPWSIALGGEAFYNDLIDRADVYEENA